MTRTAQRRPVDMHTLSLGHASLEANGYRNTAPVVVNSFVTQDRRLVLSDPKDDWYLNTIIAGALRDGEIGLVTKLIPGLREHYEELGLLTSGVELIEVNSRHNGDGRSRYNHAYTDPLGLTQTGYFNGRRATLVSTFSGRAISDEATRVGLSVMRRPESVRTENKAVVRNGEALARHGIDMLPGMLIADHVDAERAAKEYADVQSGVWMKFSLGSGGDYVTHIRQPVTIETIMGVRHKMYTMARNFFDREGFSTFDSFWPSDSFAPRNYPFVIEWDAREIGMAIEGNSQVVTHRDGSVDVISHSDKLVTEEGSYLGSMPLRQERPHELRDFLDDAARRVGRFNNEINGYYGLLGLNWFVTETVRNGSVNYNYYLLELNTRPMITTPASIIGEKLGAGFWINTNVFTDTPIRNIQDFSGLIDRGYTDLQGRTPEERIISHGMVIPVGFRTIVYEDDSTVPSPDFKVLICGRDEQHAHQIRQDLESSGKISFTPLIRK